MFSFIATEWFPPLASQKVAIFQNFNFHSEGERQGEAIVQYIKLKNGTN